MLWVLNKCGILRASAAGALLCCLGTLGAAPAAAQDALIVKSTVQDYRVGTKVNESDEITLDEGDVVTVLTKKGSRTMRGPGTFVVGANPRSIRARFANLTRERAANDTVTGAVRGANPGDDAQDRPRRPNIYFVDVAREGPVCLRSLDEVTLWRQDASEAETYSLSETPVGEGEQVLSISVPFAQRVSSVKVAGERFGVRDQGVYTITGSQSGTVTSITVIDLGADMTRPDELADLLYQNGCMAQFELLAERLAPES
jgi:hypothetical protein